MDILLPAVRCIDVVDGGEEWEGGCRMQSKKMSAGLRLSISFLSVWSEFGDLL